MRVVDKLIFKLQRSEIGSGNEMSDDETIFMS